MSFGLDNSEGNSVKKLGYYATDHASARSGFDLGIGARLAITYAGSTFYKFVGKLDAAEPLPGKRGDRYTTCTATDWFEEAAKYKLRLLDVQTNKRADENIVTVINSMTKKPSASSLAAGQDTFPTSLDTSKDETTTAYSEISKNIMSELGYGYISGATQDTAPFVSSGSPALFWPLDETSGSTYAPAVGACNLAVSDTTKTLTACPGLFGYSASFTAAASCVLSRAMASPIFPSQYQSFMVGTWFKTASAPATCARFIVGACAGNPAGQTWPLWLDALPSTCQIQFGLSSGSVSNDVVNYCKNPSFEVNVTDDWAYNQAGTGGSAIQDATQYYVGTKSCKIYPSTNFSFLQTIAGISVPDGVAVVGTARIRCSADPTGNKVFLDLGTALVSKADTCATIASNGAWEYLIVAWTNDTGSPQTILMAVINNFNDANIVWADACQLEFRGATPYCDGTVTDCGWSGTENNSTSWRKTAAPRTVNSTAKASIFADNQWHLGLGWYDTTASAVWAQVDDTTPASAAAAIGILQVTAGRLLVGGVISDALFEGLLEQPFIITGSYLNASDRAKLYNSGLGIDYARAWQSYDGGGVFTFEDRHTRPKTTTVSASLSDTMIGMAPKRERGGIFNRTKVTTHPRELSSGSVILYSLQSKPLVQPGASLILSGMYTDPDQRGVARVGGASMLAPVSPCDYQMNGASDGTGACLATAFTVSPSYGGNSVQYSIYNGGAVPGYVTRLQARGIGIYDREPTVSEKTDTSSIASYGEAVLELDLPYQSSVLVGDDASNYLLSTQKSPTTRLPQVEFIGNKSDELMRAGLQTEPGDRVKIIETATGLNKQYFVNGCEIDLPADGTIHFVWTLAPTDMTQYWILGIAGQSELDTTTRLGY
jgi:hypothetical protein